MHAFVSDPPDLRVGSWANSVGVAIRSTGVAFIAGSRYAMGRRAQIIRLRWPDVDLKVGALEWGVEWEARKYDASRRVVPLVPQLHNLLKRVYLEQGRPTQGLVCPPHSGWATTGMLNTGWLTKRVTPIWESRGLTPISLQEARHSAATWRRPVRTSLENRYGRFRPSGVRIPPSPSELAFAIAHRQSRPALDFR
jgi:hypothetical protein